MRIARRLAAVAALAPLLGAASPSGRLELAVEGLRSSAGTVRVCLTTDAAHYPDCTGDPAARTLTVPAAQAALIRFGDLPSGTYAVAMIHDENGNARLDTRFGIPREGIGFSRNPSLLFGPPRFDHAQFAIDNRPIGERIRMKYFL